MRRKVSRRRLGWAWLTILSLTIIPPALAGGNDPDIQHGSAIFHETCIVCHGANGKGAIPGAPDFTASGGVLSLPNGLLEKRVENGFHDAGSPIAMPPKGGNPSLTKDDIKDVLAYLRKTFQRRPSKAGE